MDYELNPRADENKIESDQACLILMHAMLVQSMNFHGVQPLMALSMNQALKNKGFTTDQIIKIIEGAFRQIAKLDDATMILQFTLGERGSPENS